MTGQARRGLALVLAMAIAAPALAAAPKGEVVVEPTCADLAAALRVARVDAKAKPARLAAAQAAQDDIATVLYWLHGWHVARGEASLPVTRDWMIGELKRVTDACQARSPDGAMLVSAVATK